MDLEAPAPNPRGNPQRANSPTGDLSRRAQSSFRGVRTPLRVAASARAGKARAARAPGGLASWQLARVRRHIELHLTSKLTNAGLAALVGLNEDHFARAFKVSIGRPPHSYVVERRIDRAKTLLSDSDLSLCQIALAAGFADQAHLTRRFRETVGASPALWRRRSGAGTR